MKKGKLTFAGSIDINQFWPQNSISKKSTFDSDADTIKVKVDLNSVVFTSASGAVKNTKFLTNSGFFHKTTSKKTGAATNTFKGVLDKNDNVTIRVQGIDAPELHYNTGTPLFRQHMGETSTVALFQFLKTFAKGNSSIVHCQVFTQVDLPNDVFDKYGRCVADVLVAGININHWLIENGYAFPAFYNSMTVQEINDIKARAKSASDKKLNIWKFYSDKMAALDTSLVHVKKSVTYVAKADEKSPVIFPKLFRRLWTFEFGQKDKVTKKKITAPFTTAGYQKYLAAQKDDICYLTSDFLKKGAKTKTAHLADFVDSSGNIKFKPADIVFKEAGTTLKHKNGGPLTTFFKG